MSNESYRYTLVENFHTVSLVESLSYKSGDLYRPHLRTGRHDHGAQYSRSKPSKRKFTNTDALVAYHRAFNSVVAVARMVGTMVTDGQHLRGAYG